MHYHTINSRFYSCSVPGCERPSVRAIGGCDVCNSYLCLIHMSPVYHKCSKVRWYSLLPYLVLVCYLNPILSIPGKKGLDRCNLHIADCRWNWTSPLSDQRQGSLQACFKSKWWPELHYRIFFHDWPRRSYGERQLPRPHSFPRWLSFMVTSSSTCCHLR